ncbi:MAG: hypothetical protein D6698_03575 [Gammaproteobacteria bacterium]|nr:MAG: hypothetical protein D6698_03575 [Gammaproteobacteria bacterium]
MIKMDTVFEQILVRWQHLLNSALEQDPETREALGQFDGRQILVHLEGINRAINIRFDGNQISLGGQCPENADVTLRASPFALLRFVMDKNAPANQVSRSMEVSGDLALAQAIRKELLHFEMDWQSCIAKLTGDLFAYKLVQFWRFSTAGITDHVGLVSESLADYLKEESGFLLTTFETDWFINEVDDLTARIERLEARIQRMSDHYRGKEC